ncbi:MAG TPA: amidohydrolase family protein [Armatimonadota bacterium]|nr:amidohydrolase family protein [Armatimonadota bacterium]
MRLDVCAWCATWPFHGVPHSDVDGLLHLMDRAAIDGALVAPLDAVFDRDCRGPNARLARALATRGDRMAFCAMANPRYPGWQETVRIADEDWGAVAVRVIPTYHGYRTDDQSLVELAEVLAERQLPLIVTTRLLDERSHPPAFRVPPAAMEGVNALRARVPRVTLVVSWARVAEIAALDDNVAVDLSGVQGPGGFLESLLEPPGQRRVLLGTGAVLQVPECGLAKLGYHSLSRRQASDVAWGWARELFPRWGPSAG